MKPSLIATAALLVASTCLGQSALEHDKYGGIVSLAGTRSGWFHTQEIAGRWYFVTPEGHAFFSLGVTHAEECIQRDERDLFATEYGRREDRLAEFFLERFNDWGYNSSGYGPLPTMEKRISSTGAARKASRPMTRRSSTGSPTSTTPASSANSAKPIRITWSWATG